MRSFSLPIAALSAVLLVTGVASADEAPSRPEKRESDSLPPPSVRLPTLLGGLGFTAVWWGMNTGTSYLFPDTPGFTDLRTPVIGPWKAIGHNACNPDCNFTYYFDYVYFALSGIAQAGGIGIALESLLVPTGRGGERPRPVTTPSTAPTSPLRDEGPTTPAPAPNTPMFYMPQPIKMGKAGWGIGFSGMWLAAQVPAPSTVGAAGSV